MKKTYVGIRVMALMLAAADFASGAIVGDDILVVDFGKTGQETTGNWNNAAKAANAQFTANGETLVTNLVRYSDSAATGVQLLWGEPSGSSSYAGIGGAVVASVGSSAGFTGVGTIPDNAQIDLCYFNGNQSFLQLTGLDTGLTYNLEIMSKIDAGRAAQDITVNDIAISVDPSDTMYVTAFNGISATTGGVIQISISSAGGGANLQHINALSLTAIPDSNTPPPVVGLLSINTLSSNEVAISWGSSTGAFYSVQSLLDLAATDGEWSTIHSNLPATPPQNTFTNTLVYGTEFYRVIAED